MRAGAKERLKEEGGEEFSAGGAVMRHLTLNYYQETHGNTTSSVSSRQYPYSRRGTNQRVEPGAIFPSESRADRGRSYATVIVQ